MHGEHLASDGLVLAAGHLEALPGVVALEARERQLTDPLQRRDELLPSRVSGTIGLERLRVGTVGSGTMA